MSRTSPFEVQLGDVDRAVLKQRASSRTAPHAMVVRARIVLAAAEGARNVDIAKQSGSVSTWRRNGGSAFASRASMG